LREWDFLHWMEYLHRTESPHWMALNSTGSENTLVGYVLASALSSPPFFGKIGKTIGQLAIELKFLTLYLPIPF
jgi:hypothetical protein